MHSHPPNGFRGFVWEPSTEQDVVVLFGLLLDRIPIAVAVGQTWTPFPDCVAIKTAQHAARQVVNIEFEYRSSSFLVASIGVETTDRGRPFGRLVGCVLARRPR